MTLCQKRFLLFVGRRQSEIREILKLIFTGLWDGNNDDDDDGSIKYSTGVSNAFDTMVASVLSISPLPTQTSIQEMQRKGK